MKMRSGLRVGIVAALSMLLLVWTPLMVAQGKTSYLQVYITPGEPTYVDAVTATVQVRDQNSGIGINEAGTVSVSVDGGPPITATLVESTGYVNLGQLSIASHTIAATFPGSASYAASSTTTSTKVTDAPLTFVGTQGTTLFSDGVVIGVNGAAADDANNLYITSTSSNDVQKEDIFGNITTLPFTGLSGPVGIAADTSGDLFVVDTNHNRVVELNGSGQQTVLPVSGLNAPTYIIYNYVNGYLYIADPNNDRIVQFDPATGAQTNAVTGLTALKGIGLDGSGHLLYADHFAGSMRVYGDGSQVPIFSSVRDPEAINGDYYGNVYVSDAGTNVLLRIDQEGNQVQVNDGGNPVSNLATDNFGRMYLPLGGRVDVIAPGSGRVPDGPVNQGNPTYDSLFSLIFQVPQAHPTFSVAVAPAKTFNTSFGINCGGSAGGCAAPFYFDPQTAGVNTGSLTATAGNDTATVALWGKGIGGGAAFSPGVSSQGASGSTAIGGTALDGAGNRYATDTVKKTVLKIPPTGAPVTLGFTGLSAPTQVAADATGAVYVLDEGLAEILRLDPNGTQSVSYVGNQENSPIINPTAFALDGDTNLVVAGPGFANTSVLVKKNAHRRVKERANASTPEDATSYSVAHVLRQDLPSFNFSAEAAGAVDYVVDTTLGPVAAVAVDAYGYIYALEASGNLWSYDTYSSTTEVATGLSGAIGLGVDSAQTAYVAEANQGSVAIVHADKSLGTLPVAGLKNPAALAVDEFGDLLLADASDGQLTFVDRTQQSYAFGNTGVGSSSTLAGTVANVGNQPFTFSGMLPANGTFAPGTGGSECNPGATPATVLGPAASCDLSYVFTPPSVGPFTYAGTLSTNPNTLFASSGLGGMQFSGAGVAATAAATLTPPTSSFGSIVIGGSATQTFTLTNTGGVGISVTSASITNGAFVIAGTTCGSTLAQAATCTYTVVFTPSAAGAQGATLTVTDDAGTQTATLTGTGTTPAVTAPIATLAPTTLNFGTVTTGGKSAAQTATLSNTGNAALTITSIALSGANGNAFSSTNTCGASLAAGATCTISIVFAPTAAGAVHATIAVTDNAAGSPQSSSLTGTGAAPVAAADFGISASPSTQSVVGGSAAKYAVAVTSVDGTFTGQVSLSATGLPAGATVTFSPSTVSPGSAGASSTMTIETAALQTVGRNENDRPGWKTGAPALAVIFFLIPLRRLRRWRGLVCVALAGWAVAALSGCGGGFGLAAPSVQPLHATVTVTGTSGTLTHAATVQITVTANTAE